MGCQGLPSHDAAGSGRREKSGRWPVMYMSVSLCRRMGAKGVRTGKATCMSPSRRHEFYISPLLPSPVSPDTVGGSSFFSPAISGGREAIPRVSRRCALRPPRSASPPVVYSSVPGKDSIYLCRHALLLGQSRKRRGICRENYENEHGTQKGNK